MVLGLEFVGALAILSPFALYQLGRLSQHSAAYLWPNLVGGALLTTVAWMQGQLGFVVLQAVWSLAAGLGLVRHARSAAD